jgi:1-acyl-sn-glycerol-3-phosphate acyltransferase
MRYQKYEYWTERPLVRWTQRVASSAFEALGNLECHGSEHIPRNGGVLLLANHACYLDPFIIGTVATREMYAMARHDVFRIPILNKILVALNAYPVKRGTADRGALRVTIELLKRGEVVLIFPGGTRTNDGTLQKVHRGVSFIVHNANVPTIPVFLKGGERLMPRDSKYIRPTKLTVTFGQPIDFTKLPETEDKRELYQGIGDLIMGAMAELEDVSTKRET